MKGVELVDSPDGFVCVQSIDQGRAGTLRLRLIVKQEVERWQCGGQLRLVFAVIKHEPGGDAVEVAALHPHPHPAWPLGRVDHPRLWILGFLVPDGSVIQQQRKSTDMS